MIHQANASSVSTDNARLLLVPSQRFTCAEGVTNVRANTLGSAWHLRVDAGDRHPRAMQEVAAPAPWHHKGADRSLHHVVHPSVRMLRQSRCFQFTGFSPGVRAFDMFRCWGGMRLCRGLLREHPRLSWGAQQFLPPADNRLPSRRPTLGGLRMQQAWLSW